MSGSAGRVESIASSDVVPRSVGRVLDLLEAVLSSGRCNLTAASTATGLTPTTALRHLRALEARGYVDRDEAGRFSAGPTIQRIAAGLRGAGDLERLLVIAQPHLDALAGFTGESCYLALGDGRVATYVAAAESSRAIRHVGWVGQDVPVDGTAVGESLRTPGVPVRRTGAVESDITAVSIGVAIRFLDVAAAVAVSVVGPAHRLAETDVDVEAALTATAEQLATDIGRPGRPVED